MAPLKHDDMLDSLLDAVPLGRAAKRDLCRLMSSADRHYHGVAHAALLWMRHKHFGGRAGLRGPKIDRLVACAIAYHDAVYDAGRDDNEERSADLWLEASRSSEICECDRVWVADTIRATSDHLAYAPNVLQASSDLPLERARIWVLDLDLTPLGEEPDVFDANSRRLRAEQQHLARSDYERALTGFLRQFERAGAIYRSPVLAAAFDAMARRNIQRHLRALEDVVPDEG